MTGGYAAVREKSETVARCLRDIALLVGAPLTEPSTLETGGEIVPGLGFGEDSEALAVRARDLDGGLFKIIVLGEFKNGKSTLLNGMLGSKTLPAKAAPSTAIITMLVHGDRQEVAIHESGRVEPRPVSWEAFVQEFQLSRQDQETLAGHGTIDRFRHVEYAVIECRHPICASGVRLIDSPGLGEHLSRTRVATTFLKQAQAVIFVLNATRILTREERDFIDGVLGQGRLPHVFFVVNRINQVVGDGGEIRQWVEKALAPHFREESGDFDHDLYRRRVFFVDARGALDARATLPIDEARLEASGVPALERELERFLTGEEKVAATLHSTVQYLRSVVEQAYRRIDREKVALDQPLADLERRHAEAGQRLDALSAHKAEIERTILLFGDTIRQKVYANLRTFVEEMQATWPEDSRRLIDLDRAVTMKALLQSYTHPEARERMAAAIQEQIQQYLQVKFGEWSDGIPSVVGGDVETMMAEVEAQIDDFQLELDLIASLFAGTPPGGQGQERVSGARLLQLALTLEDISSMTDAATGFSDWKQMMGRWVQQGVIVMILTTFVTGSMLMALFFVELIQFGMQENEVKRRMRENLGERLHASLREKVEERRPVIYEAVDEHFRRLASSMSGVIQRQIDEVRAEQDRIVRRRRDERFSVEHEQQRLDAVGEKIQQLFAVVSDAARTGANYDR